MRVEGSDGRIRSTAIRDPLKGPFSMAKPELLKQFDLKGDSLEDKVNDFLQGDSIDKVDEILRDSVIDFEEEKIIQGKVVSISDDWVIVDVGYKAEGEVPRSHFEGAEITVGDSVDVLIEEVDEEDGRIMLSKRKADRIKGWEKVVDTHNEGDVVTGKVLRKIKGGLLIDIGVPVFLPASQIAIRRVGDVSEFVGKDLECKIIKIDEPRMNIVVSRRKLLEERRDELKSNLMTEIELDQDKVTGKIDEICAPYDNPDEIRNIYLQNPQFMGQIESMVLEEQVVDWLLEAAQVVDEPKTFGEVMKRQGAGPTEAAESE